MKQVYLDHAATTPLDQQVVDAMIPYFTTHYGNPSSLHSYGSTAKEAMNNARTHVANLLHAEPEEIIFTAGGTESDNIALKGISSLHKPKKNSKGPQIITSSIEHPAVLRTCEYLEKKGYTIEYLPVDQYGLIDPNELDQAITKDTFLISIMYANNEIGTIQPIKEIGSIAQKHDVVFHTDAVQAIGKTPIDVNALHIDLLSLSAHKMYGPKGTGALFIKQGIKIAPFTHGGGHEKGIRSSTQNVPGIVGLGKACELADQFMIKDNKRLKNMRDSLIKQVLSIPESYLNGHPKKRLSNNAHFRFSAIEGEALLLSLDGKGIAASTGSACSSKSLKASHVLLAIGLNEIEAHGSLRLSLGRQTSKDDIDYTVDILPTIVNNLRAMSPLWEKDKSVNIEG